MMVNHNSWKNNMSGVLLNTSPPIVSHCYSTYRFLIVNEWYPSTQGLGTDDHTLIWVMVTHCEVDMVQIYNKKKLYYGSFIKVGLCEECGRKELTYTIACTNFVLKFSCHNFILILVMWTCSNLIPRPPLLQFLISCSYAKMKREGVGDLVTCNDVR